MSSVLFSVLFFAIILALSIRESAVIDLIGKVLTPALLLGLAALIVVGIVRPLGSISGTVLVDSVVVTGVQAGYQTMDVLAALVFGAVLIKSAADKGYESQGGQMKVLAGAAGLSGALSGSSDSYLSKNKKGGLDQILASSTKWIAIVWVVLTLVLSLV